MKDRVFSFMGENEITFDNEKNYIVVPSDKIEKIYNYNGFYKKNPDYDSECYDPEDEDTYPYIKWGEEWADGSVEVFEKDDDGEFYLVDIEDLFHEEEVEEYWDGSNWKKVTLTSENEWCSYVEETDQFEEGYFDSLHLFFGRETRAGLKKEYYTDKKGRYWEKNISYWQGSYRDSFTELSEEELLTQCLPHWTPDEDDREYLPLIKDMVQPEALCINPSYEYSEYEIIDLNQKTHLESSDQTNNDITGWDIYELPDNRQVKLIWSRWQGAVNRWELVN